MSISGLIFVSHGSRNLHSNNQIAALTAKLDEALKGSFSFINYAFLEFSTPTILDAIQFQIQKGTTHITLFPYFLSMGTHVSKDIPNIITIAKNKFPNIEFKILNPLGSYLNEMTDLIIRIL